MWFAWKIVLLQYHKQRAAFATTYTSVVICLKNRTFAVSQTTTGLSREVGLSCDLLEKSYFCSITNNISQHVRGVYPVVICLKNRTFAVSQTTALQWAFVDRGCDLLEKSYFCSITNNYFHTRTANCPLWFAWKIVLLQYHKQLLEPIQKFKDSCDLLEKSYFCSITNNLAGSRVTLSMLWFAWKIVLLQYHKQLQS